MVMILLIGGAGQGKLAYALKKTGFGPENVAYDPVSARTKPIFAGLSAWVGRFTRLRRLVWM